MPSQPKATQQSEMQALRKQAAGYGRINWSEYSGEYSKLTGTPISKDAVPATIKSPEMDKQRRVAAQTGRVTASEYKRLRGSEGRASLLKPSAPRRNRKALIAR